MKLDKELYTKHAKRLAAILNDKSTFVPYLTKPVFVNVLKNSLNTLYAVEKILTKVELSPKYSAKSLTKEFNKLGKNDFKLDEKFKFEDESELIDNINYLHMYCKNIFKVNLDDLVEGKDVKASNPVIDLKARPEGTAAAAAGFGSFGGVDPEAMAYGNPYVMGQAYAKVKQEMASGQFYTYKSKPRIIPIIKWACVATIAISIIALIVGAVFTFLAKDLNIKIDGASQGRQLGSISVSSGIMYILIAAFGIYPLYVLIKGTISKNDNLKYYFNWPWVLIFILMVLIFTIGDIRWTWFPPYQITESTMTKAWSAFNVWKIMFIVIQACGGLCLIPMIIGAASNPKQDQDLIEHKLKEYADQIITASGFSQPVGKTADVQKPVDVKKPASKKAKDKAKDKK